MSGKVNLSQGKAGSVASMTGYGRLTGETSAGRITAEVRSLNHRHLDISVKVPRNLLHLDPEIRKMVRATVSRGKVEVFLTLEDRPMDFEIDLERAMEVRKELEKVASATGEKVELGHILSVGEILRTGDREPDEQADPLVLETLSGAMEKMVQHRHEEGKVLAADLLARMDEIIVHSGKIEELAPGVPRRARENMERYLAGLDLTERVDPQKLEVEVAFLAQRSDITEEITRLKAHQGSFLEAFAGGGVIGRRLDFLIQEINREINTIGAKSGDPVISDLVVDIKTTLEKVREQVQNIE